MLLISVLQFCLLYEYAQTTGTNNFEMRLRKTKERLLFMLFTNIPYLI